MPAYRTTAAVVAFLGLFAGPVFSTSAVAATESVVAAREAASERSAGTLPASLHQSRGMRAATGRVVIDIATPTGVPASIRFKGPRSAVVRKPAAGSHLERVVRLEPGRYRVFVDPVVDDGVAYEPLRAPRRLTVERDRRMKLSLRFVRADAANLGVTAVADTSAGLAWRGPAGARYVLRRATGSTAPSTRADGVKVATSGRSAQDEGLEPATTYSYALFVTRQDGSRETPVTTTLTTSPTVTGGTSGGASVTLPGAVVLPPTATPEVMITEEEVRWQVPVGQSVPALGGGVIFPTNSEMPLGFIGRVVAIGADGRTVTLRPGALVDVYSYLDIAAELGQLPSQRLRLPRLASASTDWSGRDPGCGFDAGAVLPGLAVKMEPAGHFRLAIHNSFGIPDGLTYDVRFAPTYTYQSGIHVTAGVTCSFELGHYSTPVPNPLGLPLAVKASHEVTLATGGSTDVDGYTMSATVGGYIKGTLSIGETHVEDSGHIVDVAPMQETAAEPAFSSIQLTYGGRVTFGLGGGTKALGAIGGISGHLEPVNLTLRDANPGSNTPCRNIDLATSGGLGLNVSAWAGHLSASASVDFVSIHASWPGFPTDVPTACGATTDPVISTAALSPATIGVPYEARLRTADDRPGSWALISGILPDGLDLTSDGRLTGTPGPPKVSTELTISFTDNRGRSAERDFELTVDGFAPVGLTSEAIVPVLPQDALTIGQSSPLVTLSCARTLERYCVASGDFVRTDGKYQPYLVIEEGAGTEVQTLARGEGTITSVQGIACPEPRWCALWGSQMGGSSHLLVLEDGVLTDLGITTVSEFANDDGYPSISSLSCAAAGDCAAVGTYIRPGGQPGSAFVADLDGHEVTAAPAPLPAAATPNGNASATAVTCRASGWCLALGDAASSGDPIKLVLVRDHGTWSAQAAPLPAQGFGMGVTGDLVCPEDGECTALGRTYDQGLMRAVALRLHNGSWSLTTLPQAEVPAQGTEGTHVTAEEISCPTPNDCVVVSIQGDQQGYPYYPVLASTISRLHNGTWTTVLAPNIPGSDYREPQGRLLHVDCPTRNGCVIAGTTYLGNYGGGTRRAVAFVLDGTQAPQQLQIPNDATHSYTSTLTCPTAANCIGAGHYDVGRSASPGMLYRIDLHE